MIENVYKSWLRAVDNRPLPWCEYIGGLLLYYGRLIIARYAVEMRTVEYRNSYRDFSHPVAQDYKSRVLRLYIE